MEYFVNKTDNSLIDPKKLFAYGSLMEGFFNYEKVLKNKVISRNFGKVRGLLYHQNKKGYPALVPGNELVSGELLELVNFDELILECDKLEEYFGANNPDNYYERRITEIELINGVKTSAWVYWYTRNDLKSYKNPVTYIPNGDWREYFNKE
jgi:gamma-glutamylcyclotransferase (GGCT)/AIG2-like uncharacterized protein YtfP